MTKTLKYKALKKTNQTRKMKGGVFNIFGESKKPIKELPFMYFYYIPNFKDDDEEDNEEKLIEQNREQNREEKED